MKIRCSMVKVEKEKDKREDIRERRSRKMQRKNY